MGRWGPTGLGPKEAALLGAAAVGHGGVVWLPRVALRVAVGLGPGDPLLLPPPRVVVSGVTDVVVDKRVGLLVVWVDLVLTVASLGGQRMGCQWPGGDRAACAGLRGTQVLWFESPLRLFQALDGVPLSTRQAGRVQCPLMPDSCYLQHRSWQRDTDL